MPQNLQAAKDANEAELYVRERAAQATWPNHASYQENFGWLEDPGDVQIAEDYGKQKRSSTFKLKQWNFRLVRLRVVNHWDFIIWSKLALRDSIPVTFRRKG